MLLCNVILLGDEAENHRSGDDARRFGRHGSPGVREKNRTRAESSGSIEARSEEHTSELQSHLNLVCRLLLEKKKLEPPVAQSRHKRVRMPFDWRPRIP